MGNKKTSRIAFWLNTFYRIFREIIHCRKTKAAVGFNAKLTRHLDEKSDGSTHHDYILTYVYDCLLVSHDPQVVINSLQNEYKH